MREYKQMIHHEMNESKNTAQRMINSLREVVFGLEDGIVSTLGAITGIAVGTQNTGIVIVSGLVIIFVESLSMSAGTFLSSKSENEMKERMLAEERYEIQTNPEKEKRELREFYESRGFQPDEIEMMIARVTSDEELWLEEMAYRELGIIPDEEDTAVRDAGFMGISYIAGGVIPLTAYFFLPVGSAMPISIGGAVTALFLLGYAKGKLVHTNPYKSGVEMMIVSASAAALGYVVGAVASNIFNI